MKRLLVVVPLVLVLAGCGSSETVAHKKARHETKMEADFFCTMTPAGNDPNYIYSDEYARCVKAQAKTFLAEWEAKHPGD